MSRKPLLPGAGEFADLAALQQLQQLLIPYHIPAIGSTIRAGPLRGLEDSYSKLGSNTSVDVIVFWVSTRPPPAISRSILTASYVHFCMCLGNGGSSRSLHNLVGPSEALASCKADNHSRRRSRHFQRIRGRYWLTDSGVLHGLDSRIWSCRSLHRWQNVSEKRTWVSLLRDWLGNGSSDARVQNV